MFAHCLGKFGQPCQQRKCYVCMHLLCCDTQAVAEHGLQHLHVLGIELQQQVNGGWDGTCNSMRQHVGGTLLGTRRHSLRLPQKPNPWQLRLRQLCVNACHAQLHLAKAYIATCAPSSRWHSQFELTESCCCNLLLPGAPPASVLLSSVSQPAHPHPPASVTPRKKRCTTRPVLSLMAAAAVATMPHAMVMLPYHQRAPSCIVRKVEGTWATPYPR